MRNARDILAQRVLLFDGGMGTYYKGRPGQECEQASLTDPEGVLAVHREYLEAGAEAIKTNTFSLPRMAAAHVPGWQQLARAAWALACEAAGKTPPSLPTWAPPPTPKPPPPPGPTGRRRMCSWSWGRRTSCSRP